MTAKRTIPQIRVEMLTLLDELERGVISTEVTQWFAEMRALVDETKRRSPAFKAAPTRYRIGGLKPGEIEEIKLYKEVYPEMSYREIANAVNTSIRCVSLALAGRRDGGPVFDQGGVRVAVLVPEAHAS